MELYTNTAYDAARLFTKAYSTSFGLSIRLFETSLRPYVYALYGLVRVADEIVDSYRGADADQQLAALEQETAAALKIGYSTNPIAHAFAVTARQFAIGHDLIEPFFASMRMDTKKTTHYTQKQYETYIYGSAEVIGLMLLKLCTDDVTYAALAEPARRLGAGYQKVNFLRDIAADHSIGRWYFPDYKYETFDEAAKEAIVLDIARDFKAAKRALAKLPRQTRQAIRLSFRYYSELLKKIEATPAETLRQHRVRVPDAQKLWLFAKTATEAKKL